MMHRQPYGSENGSLDRAQSGDRLDPEDEEEEEEEKGSRMMGILFGNADDNADYLEQDARENLGNIAAHLGGFFQFGGVEMTSTDPGTSVEDEEDYVKKADDAFDFEDFDEAISDDDFVPDESYSRVALVTESKQVEDDYDEDEEEEELVVASPTASSSKDVAFEAVQPVPGPAKLPVAAPKPVPETPAPAVQVPPVQAVTTPAVKHGDSLVSDISFEDLDQEWDDIDFEDNQSYEDLSPDEEGSDVDLPVMYEEHGKKIIQFSEVFGAKQPDWIIGNKKLRSKRFVSKGIVETRLQDDEAEVLRSFPENFHGFNVEVRDDQSLSEQVGSARDSRLHVSCEPLNRALSPLADIDRTQAANFDPLHQIDWESNIVWDDPDGWEPTEPGQPVGAAEPLSRLGITTRAEIKHPQMLRLEHRRQHSGTDVLKRMEKLSLTLDSRNTEFASGSWLDDICWDEPKPRQWKPIMDFTDSHMVFEVPDSRDTRIIREHAAAMIVSPRSVKGKPSETTDLTLPSRFNISNDKYYIVKKPQQKPNPKKRTGGKVVHSVPALRLQTMKPKLNNKDLANFHRPKATWFPQLNEMAAKEQGALAIRGPMRVILKPLGGKGSRLTVDASDTLESFKVKAVKKMGDLKLFEPTRILYAGKVLEEGKTFAEQKVPPNSLLHLIRSKVHFWKPQQLPSDKPMRPPGAFKKKSELSVKDGRVFLMEYCEERPLLLSNVGMGAVLSTYYRKQSSSDVTATTMSGAVIALEPAEESPFIGNIASGESQSCLETNMYRAPVFQHRVSSRDFLLVRSAKGKLSLRRIDNIHVVGQQEPHIEVTAPPSKTVPHYQGNRLLVYVYREFRGKEKPGVSPQIGAEELAAQFPNLTDAFIRKKLKNVADLQKGPNGDMRWVMRRGFRIPSEEEIRRLVTPEDVCTYESMQAGVHHLKRMGVHKLTQLNNISAAMTQLPDEALTLAAATHIERELQLTPWNLSSNFVSATLQGRNSIEKLEISGPGDPSGRGLGFSYLRVALRPPNAGAAVEKKAAAARGGGAVTGTDADLRRLSMEAAREVLLQFGVSEGEIDKLTRWHRIALVRKLSSEQAATGADLKMTRNELNKYARGHRMSAVQLQQQSKVKAQEIWERQLRSLSAADEQSDVEGEENGAGDLDDFAGDLENLLEAEEDDGRNVTARELKDSVRGGGRNRTRQTQEEDEEDEAAEAAELQRMLMEEDDAEEDQRRRRAANSINEPATTVPSLPPVVPGPSSLSGPPRIGVKRKQTVLKRTVNVSCPDGKVIKKVEVIRDPIQVANFLARRNEKQRAATGKITAEKKVTLKVKDKKVAPSVKTVITTSVQKNTKARDKVCGVCGQTGHMRTNKKKCPLYAGGAGVPRSDPEEIDKPETKATTVEPVPKVRFTFKTSNGHEPPPKIRIKQPRYNPEAEAERKKQEQGRLSESQQEIEREYEVVHDAHAPNGRPEEVELQSTFDHFEEEDIDEPVQEQRPTEYPLVQVQRPTEVISLSQVQSSTPPLVQRATENPPLTPPLMEVQSDRQPEQVGKKRHRTEEDRKEKKKKRKEHKEHKEHNEPKEHKERKDKQKSKSERKVEEVPQAPPSREQEQLRNALTVVRQPQVAPPPRIIIKRNPQPPPPPPPPPPAAPEPPAKRQKRGSGEVELANILEEVVDSMRKYECSKLFRKAVTKREAPDYRQVISTPMDLSIIRDRARKQQYRNREDFLTDVQLIVDNAHTYNEHRYPGIPPLADQLFQVCEELLESRQEELEEVESRIDQVDERPPVVVTAGSGSARRGGRSGGRGGGRKRSLRTL